LPFKAGKRNAFKVIGEAEFLTSLQKTLVLAGGGA
jgi:hypothetical protein